MITNKMFWQEKLCSGCHSEKHRRTAGFICL